MLDHLRGLLVITCIILAFSALVHPASSVIFSSSDPGTLLIIQGNNYAPDELIVRFLPEIADDEGRFREITNHLHALLGTAMKKDLGNSGLKGVQIVHIPGSLSVQEALTLYRNNPFVLYAEPNYKVSIVTVPNDPSFSQQWALHNTASDADINAPEAWDITTGSSDVVIAVIDTGVDYTHPDLAANIWTNPGEIPGNGIDDDRNGYVDDTRGWDFISNDNNPADDNGHGTHCAGIIGAAGNNGAGTSGVNWHTKIMPLKFLDASGSGTMSDAAEAILYAQRNGAYITSNSYGGTGFSQTMKDAIDGTGILVVCAAGNSARDNDLTPMYPASYTSPNVISVAATDRYDNLASYSNYGAVSVDVAAPGSGIYSTYRGGVYTTLSGTSMATPHVAGIAGLIRSVRPDLNAAGIKSAIMDGVDKKTQFSANTVSKGRANAYGALSMVTVSDHCTVTAISPSSGLNTGITPLESISGNGFDPGAQVRLRKAGQADIEGATVTIVSGSRITCTFDLNGKQAGSWDVVVTNPDEQSGTLTGGFTITTPPPPPVLSVTGISPAAGYSNGSIAITSLTGTAFASGYIPSLRKTGQADINGTGVTIVSSTKITCTFNLTGKQAGIWDVVVTSPDDRYAILPGAFSISAPPPPPSIRVTGITPNTGFNNGTVTITDLKGAGFVTGSKPSLRRSGQADINGTGISIVSSTKITCTFNLNGKQAGAWDIVVTKPDGQSATLPGGFTVATPPAKLSVTGITPNSAKRGTTVTITSLAGTGFTSGAVVRLQKTGKSDIIASNVVVVSASKITARCTIPASTTPGYWNVRVTTPDGRTAVKNYAFNVRY